MPNLALIFRADDPQIYTAVGARSQNTIVLRNSPPGMGLYGPYVDLPRGRYLAEIHFSGAGTSGGRVVMDVTANAGNLAIKSLPFDLAELGQSGKSDIGFEFFLEHTVSQCEVRLRCSEGVFATITEVGITFLDLDRALVENVLSGVSSEGMLSPLLMARLDRLERLSHGGRATYVGNNRILVKLVVGDTVLGYFMPADDRLISPATIVRGEYEPGLTRYFVENVAAGHHCLDVGGNYGYYTCLMASLARQGKTIGVEPDQAIFELLRDNVYINAFEAVASGMHAAVADFTGRLTLSRRVTRSGNTSIIKYTDDYAATLGEAPPEVFEVDCVSIDDLLPRFDGRIDIIKIDAEGAEPLVLRGARQTLAANPRVKIVMEWSPGQIVAAGFEIGGFIGELAELGFKAAVIGPAAGPEPIALHDLLHASYHSGVLLSL